MHTDSLVCKTVRGHLLRNIGKGLSIASLGGSDYGTSAVEDAIRELSESQGYVIERLDADTPASFVLHNPAPLPWFDRSIPLQLVSTLIEQDDIACSRCGAVSGEPDPYDNTRRVRLYIDWIAGEPQVCLPELSDLRAICSVCNEGASNITLQRPTAHKLLVQIRRAPAPDQIEVLKWLASKFPKQMVELASSSKPKKPAES
ncbi:hypothetical protein DES53_11195 [Roseimicrobium gellanilyticum]|uniref:HNH endonuclease n=1 Tax=Roseimicrobium gellanilyticum TaxID=748857 RepID=A0A366H9S5_9BACT|nr:hypothetical protein DES53_11195 [Roseimicrobium gellanilyticum]